MWSDISLRTRSRLLRRVAKKKEVNLITHNLSYLFNQNTIHKINKRPNKKIIRSRQQERLLISFIEVSLKIGTGIVFFTTRLLIRRSEGKGSYFSWDRSGTMDLSTLSWIVSCSSDFKQRTYQTGIIDTVGQEKRNDKLETISNLQSQVFNYSYLTLNYNL